MRIREVGDGEPDGGGPDVAALLAGLSFALAGVAIYLTLATESLRAAAVAGGAAIFALLVAIFLRLDRD